MSRDAIEVGAFTWSRIQRLYDADPVIHWQRCEAEGLQCPQEVFTQLFHEEAKRSDLPLSSEPPTGAASPGNCKGNSPGTRFVI